jgi:hypothetical protein
MDAAEEMIHEEYEIFPLIKGESPLREKGAYMIFPGLFDQTEPMRVDETDLD